MLQALRLDHDVDAWISALASAPSATIAEAEVPGLLELDEEAAGRALAALLDDGWIQVWDGPDGVAVILSPAAAGRLGLEFQDDGAFRWVAAGEARNGEPRPARRREWPETDSFSPDGPGIDGLADPKALPPDRAALEADEAERRRGRRGREWRSYDFFRPRLILGTDWTWPVPWRRGEEPCPVCGALERLHILAYCSICHRAGIDCRLEQVDAHERPRPTTAEDGLSGGRGEAVPGKAPRIDPKPQRRPGGRQGVRARRRR